jgi:hypothetical protein
MFEALVIVFVIVVALWLTAGWSGRYWRYRVNEWAEREGCTLLDFRSARPLQGLRRLLRLQKQMVFRLRATDAGGRLRQGTIVFERCGPGRPAYDEVVSATWE